MNAGVIDENENVTLEFSHASEYLVVVNDRRMSDEDVLSDLNPGSGDSQQPEEPDGDVGESTGTDQESAAGAAVAVRNKKKR